MIKYFLNFIVCKFKKHSMVDAGKCPFTNQTYIACVRCGKMKSI
jgi:hypothetical protein